MSERVLKLHFRGHCFDLVIPDVDKCLLLEVLNDMVDGYVTNGWELPEFPVLQFSYREKSHHLVDDGTLMRMFDVIKSKSIDIWVGCLSEPNFIWNLAQQTRELSAKNNNEPIVPKNQEKLPVRRSDMNSKTPQCLPDVIIEPEVSLVSSPPKNQSPTPFVNNNHSPNTHPSVEIIFPSPRRSPRLSSQSSNLSITNQLAPPPKSATNAQELNKKVTKISKMPVSFPFGKKMPKSTGVMKGLWAPTELKQVEPKVNNVVSSRTRRRLAISNDVGEVDGGSDSDSQGDYEPDDMSLDGSEDDLDVDFEEGDIENLKMQNYVDGGWEPLQKEIWVPDDSGRMTKVFKNGDVYGEAEIGQIKLKLWQLFVDKDYFRDVLRDFCIQEGFSLVVRNADNLRYTAECADERCSWRIHAAILDDGHTWAIKSLQQNHKCDLNLVHNPMCSAEWAAKKLLDDIKANPDIKGKTLNALLWERWGLTMATSSLYRLKAIAMNLIQGGHDESYTNLPQYCELLKSSNPGSIAFCTWATIMQPQKCLQFKSIFVSFAAQFRGLVAGCRGLVGVDGCHLKGNYGGILLSAVSLDGNNEIFPVAVAVVDSENKTSWSWFFHHLKTILTQTGREDWTIMSDRQKGIDPSLDSIWPKVPRRYCARHLCKNFKTEYL